MTELAASAARNHLAEAIDDARRTREPIYVTRRGRRVAVIVDVDTYESLVEAFEEAEDRAELRAARAENDYVPWEGVHRRIRATRDLAKLGPPPHVGLAAGTPSLSEILRRMRDEDDR